MNKWSSVICGMSLPALCVAIGLLVIPVGNTQEIEPGRVGLEFRCPEYRIACCEPMKLQADVFGAKEALGDEVASLIRYRWDVLGGKVIAGQRTSEVTIFPDTPSTDVQTVRVTLKLDGGPPYLAKEKSCTLTIDSKCVAPLPFDEFQQMPAAEEGIRLDRLASYLTKEAPASIAFLVAYAGRDSCFWEAELWSERARKYLINKHRIQPDRVVAIDGGFREHLTMAFFTSPTSCCGPFPKPTLFGSKANVKRSCGSKYKESVGS